MRRAASIKKIPETKMFERYFVVLCLLISIIQFTWAEECQLEDNCRLVDINGDDDWVKIPGHYRSIQECINDANSGDTCLVRAGRYQEQMVITEKNNISMRILQLCLHFVSGMSPKRALYVIILHNGRGLGQPS